eukprot:3089389-Amphidinium_carterae.3
MVPMRNSFCTKGLAPQGITVSEDHETQLANLMGPMGVSQKTDRFNGAELYDTTPGSQAGHDGARPTLGVAASSPAGQETWLEGFPANTCPDKDVD